MEKLAYLEGGIAVVIGSTGGIGGAVYNSLSARMGAGRVFGVGRTTTPLLDLMDEGSIQQVAAVLKAKNEAVRLIFDATGALSWDGHSPEKSWRSLDAEAMSQAFAVNAIGPALLMKHFLPLLPKDGKAVFATLSARVGSISDNQLGGWYSYRASKAALNQLVRCAAIELKRSRKEAVCVALHPGTVATGLSDGFAKTGLEVQTPELCAERLLDVLDTLNSSQTGGFFDHHGKVISW